MSALPAVNRGGRTHQMVIHFSQKRPPNISSHFRVFGVFRGDFVRIDPAWADSCS
jgi:hypothetical protein